MTGLSRRIVVVAYAHAQLTAYLVVTDKEGRDRLDSLLHHLRTIGRVAWFAWQLPPTLSGLDHTIDAIAGAIGRFTVDAALASIPMHVEAAPAWLMPVWPFDHRIGGWPASTADLMGMPLELRARPCDDDESGVSLPGWSGRWWINATTIGSDRATL